METGSDQSVKNVVYVHGYSETTLGAYYDFPNRVQARLPSVQSIVVSAFESLDDTVSIDDLAAALEDQIAILEGAPHNWKMSETAFVCHSTGALVVRRWMLDRGLVGATPDALPSHLLTMAGANHGSSLAQIGRSTLGYLQKLVSKQSWFVGARVLEDLDYGSAFLLRLSEQWLTATQTDPISGKSGPLAGTYLFSLGGDTKGSDPAMDLYWATKEPGSDNTVRISGANLNYTIVLADAATNVMTVSSSEDHVPHLILHGYSHFGNVSGIWGANVDPDLTADAAAEALKVSSDTDYQAVRARWLARTKTWTDANGPLANSTVVFTVVERGDVPVPSPAIAFLDKAKAPAGVVGAQQSASDAAVPGTPFPFENNARPSSISFYLNYDAYCTSAPHLVHIEAHNPSPIIEYRALDYDPPSPGDPTVLLIRPNETTYVKVVLRRDTDQTFAIYDWLPGATPLVTTSAWQPFPAAGRIIK